jgi:cell division control protein 45
MGGTYDLPLDMWFGNFDLQVTVHVIDSARPYSLVTLFMGGPFGDRVIVWDDGTCQELNAEKTSWEIIEV